MPPDRWLDLAGWRLRPAELGALRVYDDGRPIVVMELAPQEPDRADAWRELCRAWLVLDPQPNVIDAIDHGEADRLLVRYAALDWKHGPVRVAETTLARQLFATHAAQVTDVLRRLTNALPEGELGYFMRPFVHIDLANEARVMFLPAAPGDPQLPPEARARWPRCDERTAIYVAGYTIRTCAAAGNAMVRGGSATSSIAASIRRRGGASRPSRRCSSGSPRWPFQLSKERERARGSARRKRSDGSSSASRTPRSASSRRRSSSTRACWPRGRRAVTRGRCSGSSRQWSSTI